MQRRLLRPMILRRQIYNPLCKIGFRIPRDISLLSFDNQPPLQISPVSSVDFGMGYLGYSAFHYLFGVLPVKHERNGDIASTPHIVNRGSTGPAPRKGFVHPGAVSVKKHVQAISRARRRAQSGKQWPVTGACGYIVHSSRQSTQVFPHEQAPT